jgi:Family of unknown function (DUF6188)
MEMLEATSGWSLKFSDAAVAQVVIDARVGVVVLEGSETVILTFESAFALVSTDSETVIVPGSADTLLPVLRQLNARVQGVVIDRQGRLTCTLSGGDRIVADSDARFESWQVAVANKALLWVCQPGGGVAYFQGQTPNASDIR